MLQLRRAERGHVVVLFCTAFFAIIQSVASIEMRRLLREQSLTDCAIRGTQAAAEAAQYACYNVKLRCQPSALETILEPPITTNDLFDDMNFTCLRTAETSCQTDSRQSITPDVDRICSDLLLLGPPVSISGCLSISDVTEEFNWSVRDFCSQNLEPHFVAPASAPSVEEALESIG